MWYSHCTNRLLGPAFKVKAPTLPWLTAVYVLQCLGGCTYTSADQNRRLLPEFTSEATKDTAARARAGDKRAQLALGIAFEEGIGVPADKQRAIDYYRSAAADGASASWLYFPAVGNGTKGRVVEIRSASQQKGLPEAQRRLARLLGKD